MKILLVEDYVHKGKELIDVNIKMSTCAKFMLSCLNSIRRKEKLKRSVVWPISVRHCNGVFYTP